MRNIYLIGMMGSGKTVTGKELARLMHMDFLDLDEEIESKTHLSINEIFREKGEPFFRAEENGILADAACKSNTVIATGGGIVLAQENIERMQQTGHVIYLKASAEALWERVRNKKDRPLLTVSDPKAILYHLFQERRPLYESSCHVQVDTTGLSPEATAKKIVDECLK